MTEETKAEGLLDDIIEKFAPPPTKHFIESTESCIMDALDGLLYTNSNISRIYSSDKSIKIIYRSDWSNNTNKVAIISGGGSGHEPAHAGFVGKGMLTAAVCGEIFSSPPRKAILNAILKVATSKGVLLIIKNYTGDMFNFVSAQKTAQSMGIKCEYVVVNDDVALSKTANNVGPRGIAGTVLVHKVAGYYSENGLDLNNVKKQAQYVIDNIGTIGVSATICNLIGIPTKTNRIKDNELEMGLGIHGEPGYEKVTFDKISKIIELMLSKLLDFSKNFNYLSYLNVKKKTNKKIVILINNLHGLTPIELSIINKYTINAVKTNKYLSNFELVRIFCGNYVTSLDMKGFSISIMQVNDDILKALDSPTDCISFIPGFKLNKNAYDNCNDIKQEIKQDDDDEIKYKLKLEKGQGCELSEKIFSKIIKSILNGCQYLIKNEMKLNNIDSIVGDSDCGTTFSIGATLISKQIKKFIKQYNNTLSLLLFDIGNTLADKMGGSSGPVMGTLLISMSDEFKQLNNNNININEIIKVFNKTLNETTLFCGAGKGDRTMMDAWIGFVESLNEYKNDDINKCINNALKKTDNIVKNTQYLKPKYGRATYLSKNVYSKCEDPGARAVYIFLHGFVNQFIK